MKTYLIFIIIALAFLVVPASATTWTADGEKYVGNQADGPTFGYNVTGDGKWTMITGSSAGIFYSHNWSGTEWVIDNNAKTGLLDVGSNSHPELIYDFKGDGKWVLITGEAYGTFIGYYWNGVTWVGDSSIISGFGDVGTYPTIDVVYNMKGDSNWSAIIGLSDGTFIGYYWTGSTWVSDNSYVNGLSDVGDRSDPAVAYNVMLDSKWVLVAGESNQNLNPYYWNGTGWVSDSDIISGLTVNENYCGPAFAQDIKGDGNWTIALNLGNNNDFYTKEGTSVDETPPASITGLSNATGDFYHNWTWTNPVDADFNGTMIYIGGSHITNVSSTTTHYYLSSSAHDTSTISTRTYDTTGNINATWVNHTSSIANNAISISDVAASYTLNEGETLSIDADYTDADSDTGTFADNSSEWNVDSSTGVVSWLTANGDNGVYNYYINVSDGYGSVDTQIFTVTVNDSIYAPTVTFLSLTPSPLYQNTTGDIKLSWGIEHSTAGINNTTLAVTFAFLDVLNGNFNQSIRYPSNDRSDLCCVLGEYILRANNRNELTPLNWEGNATITEGNVSKWSGGDENTSQVNIVVVNSTYTYVYWNGTAKDTLWPGSWYLDRDEQTSAIMTEHTIDKLNSVLIQSVMPGCGESQEDKLLNMGIDTHTGVLSPIKPIKALYLNDSYDPLGIIDPADSPYSYLLNTMNITQWTTHTYTVDNSTYTIGFTVNTTAIKDAGITPTTKFYVYLYTEESSAKPYYINKTNGATSTNRTFAQTNSMWIGDGAPFTAHPYTTNAFFMTRSNESQFQHKLYIADNDGLWNNTGLQTSNIAVSVFPPSNPVINYFTISGTNDYDMDGTYNGTFNVGVAVSNDPDGGTVTHNLTLHYSNQTYLATINNTFTDACLNGCVYADIEFNSSAYNSTTLEYTMRITATDDDGDSVTVWLPVNFSILLIPTIVSYTPTDTYDTIINTTATFDITFSQTGNITWYLDGVSVQTNNSTTSAEYVNTTGIIGGPYNVSAEFTCDNGELIQTWAWTVSDDTVDNGIPLPIYIMWILILVGTLVVTVTTQGTIALTYSVFSLMISGFLTMVTMNGQLIEVFGYVSSTDAIVTGHKVIQVGALSWILLFITIVSFGLVLYHAKNVIEYQMKPELEANV